MSNQDNNFAPGFYAKRPHQNAPSFVISKVSVTLETAINYLMDLRDQGEEYLNLKINESKAGNFYIEVDTWKPDPGHNGNHGQQEPPKASKPKKGETIYDDGEDLPF